MATRCDNDPGSFCRGCGKPLARNPRRKGDRCQRCACSRPRPPETRAKLRAAMLRRFAEPGYRERHAKRAGDGLRRAIAERPDLREQLRQRGRAVGALGHTQFKTPSGHPDRVRAGRKLSEFYMSWCPLEYRDEYRRLVRSHRYRAADARAVIEQQIAADLARYQATGQLQVNGRKKHGYEA